MYTVLDFYVVCFINLSVTVSGFGALMLRNPIHNNDTYHLVW